MINSKEETLSSLSVPNKRMEWIDVAKGLGLVLTILGHLLYSGTWSTLNKFIYSFHMPMYFILSGFVAHSGGGGIPGVCLSVRHINFYCPL